MRKIRSTRGFTIIEVVAVLLLVGILAAVAIARVTDNTAEEVAAANQLKAHLRFAQMQAMNSDTVWEVQASGGSYNLFDSNGARSFPGEDGDIDFPTGTTATFTVSFDGWGRPTVTGTFPTGYGISIENETGFIP